MLRRHGAFAASPAPGPGGRASVDDSAHGTRDGLLHPGERAADELVTDDARLAAARRLAPLDGTAPALDRLVALASRLLGTTAGQVSLLTDVQRVAAGAGLAPGTVGSESPLAESLCAVTAASGSALVVPDAWNDERVHDLPPVSSGEVGAYLGIPLVERGGRVIGVLCVFGPDARAWSDDDVDTLRQLADSAVTELELSAPGRTGARRPGALGPGHRRGRHRHVRLGPRHRPARLGRAADRHVRVRRGRFRRQHRGVQRAAAPGRPAPRDRDAAALDRHVRRVRRRVPDRPARRRDPLGARARSRARRPGRHARCASWARRTTRPSSGPARPR